MVGVSNTNKVTGKTVEWLASGGRKKIYKLTKRLEKKLQKEGKVGNFSCLIGLPDDIIFYEEFGGGFGRFGAVEITKRRTLEYWRSLAERATKKASTTPQRIHDKLKHGETVHYEATVKTGKEVYGLADDEIYTDFSWHGEVGATIIFNAIGRLIETNCGPGSASWL